MESLQGGSDDETDFIGAFEDWDVQEMERSEYEELAESFTIGGNISKKAAAYQAFLGRPNVQTGTDLQTLAES